MKNSNKVFFANLLALMLFLAPLSSSVGFSAETDECKNEEETYTIFDRIPLPAFALAGAAKIVTLFKRPVAAAGAHAAYIIQQGGAYLMETGHVITRAELIQLIPTYPGADYRAGGAASVHNGKNYKQMRKDIGQVFYQQRVMIVGGAVIFVIAPYVMYGALIVGVTVLGGKIFYDFQYQNNE